MSQKGSREMEEKQGKYRTWKMALIVIVMIIVASLLVDNPMEFVGEILSGKQRDDITINN